MIRAFSYLMLLNVVSMVVFTNLGVVLLFLCVCFVFLVLSLSYK